MWETERMREKKTSGGEKKNWYNSSWDNFLSKKNWFEVVTVFSINSSIDSPKNLDTASVGDALGGRVFIFYFF